mmetsp:Transcript_31216/g.80122  ORF Transcript_31216/g.80122 Transcript_31216/m.80122 type:complete len:316 (-) Transcript_31216:23-970(-)
MAASNCKRTLAPTSTSRSTVNGKAIFIIAVYVDNILICSTSRTLIRDFKAALGTTCDIKDLRTCKWLLGMAVDLEAKTITLHQSWYTHNLLHRFAMDECKPAATPTSANDPCESPLLNEALHRTTAASWAGALLYASVATRLDITETVSRLCRFVCTPAGAHLEDTKTCALSQPHAYTWTHLWWPPADISWLKRWQFQAITSNYNTTYPSGCKATSYFSAAPPSAMPPSCSHSSPSPQPRVNTLPSAWPLRRPCSSDICRVSKGFQQALPTPIGEDDQACIAIATLACTRSRTKQLDSRLHFVHDAHRQHHLDLL